MYQKSEDELKVLQRPYGVAFPINDPMRFFTNLFDVLFSLFMIVVSVGSFFVLRGLGVSLPIAYGLTFICNIILMGACGLAWYVRENYMYGIIGACFLIWGAIALIVGLSMY